MGPPGAGQPGEPAAREQRLHLQDLRPNMQGGELKVIVVGFGKPAAVGSEDAWLGRQGRATGLLGGVSVIALRLLRADWRLFHASPRVAVL